MPPKGPDPKRKPDPAAVAKVRDQVAAQQGKAARRVDSYGADELETMVIPEIRWIIPDLLPEGLSVLAGKPKLGKSTLILEWAFDAARGFYGKPQGCYYLALEDNKRRLQTRMGKLTRSKNAPWPKRLRFTSMEARFPRLRSGGMEDLHRHMEDHPDTRLLVIDTLAKVKPPRTRGGDAYQEDADLGGELHEFAHSHHIALTAVVHARKAFADDWLDEISGTNGFVGAADTVMLLRRQRAQVDATLSITGRDVDERNLAMRGDWGRGTWAITGDADDLEMSDTRRKILEYLRANRDKPQPPGTIAKATDLENGLVRAQLFRMVRDGQVMKDDKGYLPA
jgi:hypothetical protein